MNKRIKNILRCYAAGMGIKETASTFHTSRNTVRKYVRLFLSSGKSIDQLLSLSEEQLHEMFGGMESCADGLNSFGLFCCMRCLAVGNPDVGSLLPKGLSWRLCFPDMYPA